VSGPGPAVPVRSIPAGDLRLLLEGAPAAIWILDTRPREEYERGHLPGALHCPVHELSRRERELPPRVATVVVVGEEGPRGRAGGVFLVLAGYGSVLLLEGGFPAWTGPVETGPGRPLSAAHPPKPAGWSEPPRAG
jgi:rhodanese-related sulfurtransferase